jgi:RNA-directed DNA polymerase
MPGEGRDLSSRRVSKVADSREIGANLKPLLKTVGKLQTALHSKAKAEPEYRFYALYDKIYRQDVLTVAYHRCRSNKGAAGVDGQTFADIEKYGLGKWLGELTKELKDKTYQSSPVRRVWIPKADGKQRPLGIPTIRDRVVQTAATLVLEPIFEADLQPEQYAYRSGHSALDAIHEVQGLLDRGYREVVDADLSGYFDTIPHHELMKCVARRISDRNMLQLIKRWLQAPVEQTDERGRKRRTTRNKDEGRGTPQGGVASPLLANLYMRRFVLGWKVLDHAKRLNAYIVNYADDFVILCRNSAAKALATMRAMMDRLRLTVNEKKTRRCDLPVDKFTFLGYTFGRRYSRLTGRGYIGPAPAAKKVQQLCRNLSDSTDRRTCHMDTAEKVRTLNLMIRGWANYFCLGTVVRAYEIVMKHTRRRLRRWLCRKYRVRVGKYTRFPNDYLHEQLGLIQLRKTRQNLLWAKG